MSGLPVKVGTTCLPHRTFTDLGINSKITYHPFRTKPPSASTSTQFQQGQATQTTALYTALTHAGLFVGSGDVAGVAVAVVAALHVDAGAVLADARVAALVHIFAGVRLQRPYLAGRALTAEGACRVDALAALAQARDRLTFVYVCRRREADGFNVL